MKKSLEQRRREAAWRQARLELFHAYEGRSDAWVEQELLQARRDRQEWAIFSLEKEQRQRAEWLQTFLEADAAWLHQALEGKVMPEALELLVSGPLRKKGLDYLLPVAQPSPSSKPRF